MCFNLNTLTASAISFSFSLQTCRCVKTSKVNLSEVKELMNHIRLKDWNNNKQLTVFYRSCCIEVIFSVFLYAC